MNEVSAVPTPVGGTADHEPHYQYWAFISYSHADERWASWLHRALETYRVPKAVAGTVGADGRTRLPPRFFPLFRDREELSSAPSLGERIQGALAASRNLIVICSPSAVRSHWVNEEIRAFKALGRESRVFCLIVEGEPNASETPGAESQECFPEAIRYSVDAAGHLTSDRIEPLAADVRAEKDGKGNALLKLSAGLLGVGFDTLRRRDQERRTRQLMMATATLSGIVLVLLGLTIYAYLQKRAAEREARAARAALSGQIAIHARNVLEDFPRRSLLLAVQALRITEDMQEPSVPAAKEALYLALAETGGMVLGQDDSPVVAADLSPDGRWLVAAPERGAGARLWDLRAPAAAKQALELTDAAGPVAISPNSRWLVTAGRQDGPARLWDLTSAAPSASARVLEVATRSFSFSSNNRWLVTSGADRSVRLWDLTAASSTPPVVLPAHAAPEIGVTISPDGRWLVTSSWYGVTLMPWMDAPRLYDLSASRPETTGVELPGHTSSVTSVAFSLDSRWLATGSAERGTGRVFRSDNRVFLWDLTTPKRKPIELLGHDGPITAIAMSPDARWLAAGSADHTARVWSLQGPNVGVTSVTLSGHDGPVIGVAITPEGTDMFAAVTIAEGRRDGGRVDATTLRRWTLAPDSKIPEAVVMSHNGRPLAVSASQTTDDGRRMLLVSRNTVLVILLGASRPVPEPVVLHSHEGDITTAVFARAGRSVVTGAQDGTARLWDLDAPPAMNPTAISAEHDESFTISPDNRRLVTIGATTPEGPSNSIAVVRDLTTHDHSARPLLLAGHTGPIFDVAFNHDGRWLATASYDETTRLWDLQATDPAATPTILRGHDGPVSATTFSRDGHWLVTGSFDGTARLWDLASGDPGKAPLVLRVDGAVHRVIVTHDSRWLIVKGARLATLWDLKAPDVTRASTLLENSDGAVLLTGDDRWIVISGRNSATTSTLDLTATTPLSTLRVLDKAGAPTGASRDGRWLVTRGRKDVPLLWAIGTNGPAASPVPLSAHTDALADVAFSPDGRWLITGGYDKTARRWELQAKDIAASSQLLARFQSGVNSIAVSADSRRVLAAGTDDAYLWELADNGAWPVPIVLPRKIGGSQFTADGHRLITSHHDTRTVSAWSLELGDLIALACRTAGRNLTPDEWRSYFPGQPPGQPCRDHP